MLNLYYGSLIRIQLIVFFFFLIPAFAISQHEYLFNNNLTEVGGGRLCMNRLYAEVLQAHIVI